VNSDVHPKWERLEEMKCIHLQRMQMYLQFHLFNLVVCFAKYNA